MGQFRTLSEVGFSDMLSAVDAVRGNRTKVLESKGVEMLFGVWSSAVPRALQVHARQVWLARPLGAKPMTKLRRS